LSNQPTFETGFKTVEVMKIAENYSLKKLNTFGIEVKARYFAEIREDEELIHLLDNPVWQTRKMLILAGGSNILFTGNFDGLVIKVSTKGIAIAEETAAHVLVNAQAGENWNALVNWCVGRNLGGLENLSLIPGNVGAAPVQNIGAYGVEQKDSFECLQALEIATGKKVKFNKADCDFGYRSSIFKKELKNKFVILNVTYRLDKNPVVQINYGELKKEIQSRNIKEPGIKEVADAVCRIRNSKLPDPEKTGNAGSFFKNPLVTEEKFLELRNLYPDIPGYPSENGLIKVAAGWMIDRLGWKGFRQGDAGVCETQALVLVNYGNASGYEILGIANDIKKSVKESFDVELEPEVNII